MRPSGIFVNAGADRDNLLANNRNLCEARMVFFGEMRHINSVVP